MLKLSSACLLLIFTSLLFSCNNAQDAPKNKLFRLMKSSETGINFVNEVKDTKELNIFNFRNFYNGAGVSVGDINNDGLPDVFFTANQVQNKLYLNKGNWKFQDITESAGIKSLGKWYTGVTMADVNGDGWLDIYVCNSGGLVGYNKPNELYINQKNGTFTEEAEKYGLDDKGLTTHAAFFDFDHDGDLDCFVLNNSPRSIESFGYNKSVRNIRDKVNGDRFYRNDDGRFTDVSEAAGIYGSEIGFGLGITVGDLNNDGWEDMYISNDFFERDYLYINQKNGSFKEVINEAMGHISQGSMGSDMIDINNDGWLDVFTTEMLPEDDYKLKTTIKFDDYDVQNARLQGDFHHQFTSNCLQLNNGDGTFSEVAQLAGVDATGWSWGALSFDFDNDGRKDLYVCNGISKDLTDQDFLEFFGSNEVLNSVKEGGFQFEDILRRMPSNKVSNYAFINTGNLQFKNVSDSLGLATPSFSNGAAYADLDNDGDLDIIVNNANAEAFVYRNEAREQLKNHYLKVELKGKSPNTAGIGARVTMFTKNGMQVLEQMPSRGFQSSVDMRLHFGLGNSSEADSIIIRWPDQSEQVLQTVAADTTIVLEQKNAAPAILFQSKKTDQPLFKDVTSEVISGRIAHKENSFIDFDVERLIPKMLSTEGPCIAVADVNMDGTEDFFLANSVGDTGKIFIQSKAGKFSSVRQPSFVADKYFETTAAVFFDADGDNDPDLLLGAGGNQVQPGSPYLNVRLYKNDGKGNFSRDTVGFPKVAVNASTIVLIDIDSDNLKDIFIGARCVPGTYGLIPSSVLLKNKGNGRFEDVTASNAVLKNLGMVTDAKPIDLDKDGKEELVVAGDWMPVTIVSFESGVMKKKLEVAQSNGWWNCIEVNDIDGDGEPDIVAGNAGLNSRIRGTADRPAKLYVGDFDANGQVECVPVYYKNDGKAYPYFMKGELQGQIPALKKAFLYFSDYAGKPIESIFSEEQLRNIKVLDVNESRTCIFRNNGKGGFVKEALPQEAQLSAVFAAQIEDINNDKVKDVFVAGNFYGLKPQAGRFDASYGTTLVKSGNGYQYLKPSESGLFVNGEVRDIKKVGKFVVVAINNQPLKIFRRNFY